MKPTPKISRHGSPTKEITRAHAAKMLRYERKHGETWRIKPDQIVLVKQGYCITCPKPPPAFVPVPVTLSTQLTHEWARGYSHLEKRHELGEATITRQGKRKEREDYYSQLLILSFPKSGYRPGNIIRAIHDTLQSFCRCEHDCCGHMQTSVHSVRPLCDGLFAVRTGGYRNV